MLQPENVLLDREGNIKLADFGLSRLFGMNDRKTASDYVAPSKPGEYNPESPASDNIAYSFCGTEVYMAPELLLQDKAGYSFPVDWWTLGIFMAQVRGHSYFQKRVSTPCLCWLPSAHRKARGFPRRTVTKTVTSICP